MDGHRKVVDIRQEPLARAEGTRINGRDEAVEPGRRRTGQGGSNEGFAASREQSTSIISERPAPWRQPWGSAPAPLRGRSWAAGGIDAQAFRDGTARVPAPPAPARAPLRRWTCRGRWALPHLRRRGDGQRIGGHGLAARAGIGHERLGGRHHDAHQPLRGDAVGKIAHRAAWVTLRPTQKPPPRRRAISMALSVTCSMADAPGQGRHRSAPRTLLAHHLRFRRRIDEAEPHHSHSAECAARRGSPRRADWPRRRSADFRASAGRNPPLPTARGKGRERLRCEASGVPLMPLPRGARGRTCPASP